MEGLKDNGFLFPYIRFFNASMHGGKMDFYIGNTMVAASIGFGQYTGYMKCKTGPQSYKVTREGKKDDVIEKIIIEQNVGEVTTLCMTGKADNPQIFVINEPTDKNNITYGHLRICNLCPEKISFDVYANNKKILGDIGYREISKYMEMHGAEYDFTVFDNFICATPLPYPVTFCTQSPYCALSFPCL